MSPLPSYPAILTKLIGGGVLARADAAALMEQIMAGALTTAQIAAVAVALRLRGETAGEIAGLADAMRRHAVPYVSLAAHRHVTSLDLSALFRGVGG